MSMELMERPPPSTGRLRGTGPRLAASFRKPRNCVDVLANCLVHIRWTPSLGPMEILRWLT